jgi:hypothetical protein
MTEAQFFKRTAIGAGGLALVTLIVDWAVPHGPIPVAPFGEPWLTLLAGVVLWIGIVVVSHVGRWLYLIIRRREPNLGG